MAWKECTLDFEITENYDSSKERDIESETHSVLLHATPILSEIADPPQLQVWGQGRITSP